VESVKEINDGGLKGFGVWEVVGGTDLGLDKLPQPFDEVQVWGIWGQEYEGNIQSSGCIDDQLAMLVSGVVQDDVNGSVGIFASQVLQEFHHGGSGDVGGVVQRGEFSGGGVDGPDDVISFLVTQNLIL
jgi:hypothetical protein